MSNIQESYPTQTTGLGVAAKIGVAGNNGTSETPGYNTVTLSVSATGHAATFQLNPQLQDVSGAEITPGTSFAITSVASSSGNTAVYTGTIGVKVNSLVGQTFVVAGFVTTPANNGTFICTANNGSTTITLENASAVSESATATAKSQESAADVFVVSSVANSSGSTAVYTGTFGVASNSLVGKTVLIAGFVTNPTNNGTFVVTANNGSTTLTVSNSAAVSESASASATVEPQAIELTYVAYPVKTLTVNTYQPSGTSTAVATVSSTGLITAVAPGNVEVEVSYPTFDNAAGTTGNTFAGGLPLNKIYSSVSVQVLP